jgi:hypothetical protein
MKYWYESVKSVGASAVIFHNELSEEFMDQYKTPNISFFKWSKEHRPSYNDERFYAYFEYLTVNKNIDRIMCTDMYDVIFYRNPFHLMDRHPEYDTFVGSELVGKHSASWMIRKCKEMNYPTSRNDYSSPFMFNAGIIGGTRERMLQLFQTMIDEFKHVSKKYNANMPVFNHSLEKLPFLKIYTGHPLHNVFNSNRVSDTTYIKHK